MSKDQQRAFDLVAHQEFERRQKNYDATKQKIMVVGFFGLVIASAYFSDRHGSAAGTAIAFICIVSYILGYAYSQADCNKSKDASDYYHPNGGDGVPREGA